MNRNHNALGPSAPARSPAPTTVCQLPKEEVLYGL
jgi:hypothetical protein